VTSGRRPCQNMPGKSPRVKLNISSSASSTASGEAKGVAQLLETLDGEASWYPSEKVRVLGFLCDVKPNYSKEGVTSFTVIGKSDPYNSLPRWKAILVFKAAEDTSKNPLTIDVICWAHNLEGGLVSILHCFIVHLHKADWGTPSTNTRPSWSM